MKIVISIFLVLALVLTTSKVKVNVPYLYKEKKSLKIVFNVKVEFYLFGILKIIGITLKNEGIHFLFFKFPYTKLKISKTSLQTFKNFSSNHILKKLKINFEKIHLEIIIGMENAMTNAIIVGFLSGILSSLSGMKKDKINFKHYYYCIIPVYDANCLSFDGSFQFSMKLSNIMKVYVLIQKNYKMKNKPIDIKPNPIKI